MEDTGRAIRDFLTRASFMPRLATDPPPVPVERMAIHNGDTNNDDTWDLLCSGVDSDADSVDADDSDDGPIGRSSKRRGKARRVSDSDGDDEATSDDYQSGGFVREPLDDVPELEPAAPLVDLCGDHTMSSNSCCAGCSTKAVPTVDTTVEHDNEMGALWRIREACAQLFASL